MQQRIWVADLWADGTVGPPTLVTDGPEESVCQPVSRSVTPSSTPRRGGRHRPKFQVHYAETVTATPSHSVFHDAQSITISVLPVHGGRDAISSVLAAHTRRLA
jgi:hypothetical protein